MPSAQLSRRVGKVVGQPPLSELGDLQRCEFHEALLEADTFEDLPGKWQAAILEAEQNRPKLRVVTSDKVAYENGDGPSGGVEGPCLASGCVRRGGLSERQDLAGSSSGRRRAP